MANSSNTDGTKYTLLILRLRCWMVNCYTAEWLNCHSCLLVPFLSVLFFIGVMVGYIFVFPLTLRFLGTYQVSEMVTNQISLQSYISMFTQLILIMGVVFEMPALALILSKIGIINKSLLKKYRKHAFTILMIAAAIITPSGDAFTLFIVGTPLYLLYEFSILICRDIDK